MHDGCIWRFFAYLCRFISDDAARRPWQSLLFILFVFCLQLVRIALMWCRGRLLDLMLFHLLVPGCPHGEVLPKSFWTRSLGTPSKERRSLAFPCFLLFSHSRWEYFDFCLARKKWNRVIQRRATTCDTNILSVTNNRKVWIFVLNHNYKSQIYQQSQRK